MFNTNFKKNIVLFKTYLFDSVVCSVPDVAYLDLSSWLHHYPAFCIGGWSFCGVQIFFNIVNISRLEILVFLLFSDFSFVPSCSLVLSWCIPSLVSFSIFSISSSLHSIAILNPACMYYILVFMRFIRQYTGVVIPPFRLPFFPVCNMLPRCDRCTPNLAAHYSIFFRIKPYRIY